MNAAQKKDILVILDNEGPQTLNDNAQENTVALAEKCGLGKEVGISLYRNLSNIDDRWGDFHLIAKDPSYSSGHTLKVVLPFYKAMGATSQWLYEFARKSLRVVPNIDDVLASLNRKYNVWMVSTSYEFFVRAFCDRVGFDLTRDCCTFVPKFDEIPISEEDTVLLLEIIEEITQMPIIRYDGTTGEVIPEHQAYYKQFTHLVWEIVYHLPVGELLRIVHPVGQTQKRETVEDICRKLGVPKSKVMYVGDSQTDVQVVEWLRAEGLTMMFNGKGRVCGISDIMYIGEDAGAIEEVADLFAERGRQGVINYYTPSREARCGGLLAAVTPENIGELEPMSVKKRKEFRGVSIGELT